MGLTFTVGNPAVVFVEPFAAQVSASLAEQFKGEIVLDSTEDTYYSEELGWSGWGLLQERAAEILSADNVPHLLSMEAWNGCYVPAVTSPGALNFEGVDTPLDIASLARLIAELEAFGSALGLPTDEAGLSELAEKYLDDDLVDDDLDLQTYAHLLLAAQVAQSRQQVLWIVK